MMMYKGDHSSWTYVIIHDYTFIYLIVTIYEITVVPHYDPDRISCSQLLIPNFCHRNCHMFYDVLLMFVFYAETIFLQIRNLHRTHEKFNVEVQL